MGLTQLFTIGPNAQLMIWARNDSKATTLPTSSAVPRFGSPMVSAGHVAGFKALQAKK